ncbi:MAG: ring-cleaving dioxygenase [Pseudomonadota bacterium]
MSLTMTGLHHVTAIAGDAQANIEFYTGFLGLRLVKRTVNFDDPGTYHFYFGDEKGTPGSILTFFPFQHAGPGRTGAGMASAIAFAIPEAAADFWMERLADTALDFDGPERRFDEDTIAFSDPDGLRIELIAVPHNGGSSGWVGGPVPPEQAISHIHSVTLCVEAAAGTVNLLTDAMGFERQCEDGDRLRLKAPGGDVDSFIDLACQPDRLFGAMGTGTFHHVAFRAAGDEEQQAWREFLVNEGLNVTPIVDRQYFRSIYFREPGGVLFEIATDPPGFLIDEAPETLGQALKLPAQLEGKRDRIEQTLPPIRTPADGR